MGKDSFLSLAQKFAFALAVIQLGLIGIFWQKLPPQIPLFYSRPWGEKQLADGLWLGILPVLSLVVILVNSLLANFIIKKTEAKAVLGAQILVLFTGVFCFLCFFTLFRIILLVI